MQNTTYDKDCYTIFFVRQDISIAQQMVQVAHAAMLTPKNITKVLIFGCENLEALHKELDRLIAKGITCYPFYEPPMNNELTAIATRPLTKKEKYAFTNYKLWNIS
jgi:hypothetical protein